MISVRQLSTGVEVHADGGNLTVEPRSETIIHVRFGHGGYRGNHNPPVTALRISDKPKTTRSGACRVVAIRLPFVGFGPLSH
jgi:hypothetical protein